MSNEGPGPLHIGLIGATRPGATDFYYRRIISAFAQEGAPLELTIVHADAPSCHTSFFDLAETEAM